VSIFFTLNGILLGLSFLGENHEFHALILNFIGKKIPIGNPGDSLYPTVRLCDASVEANFGDDSAKPFRYDIDKCPGLDME
jgi:hypothetical protein